MKGRKLKLSQESKRVQQTCESALETNCEPRYKATFVFCTETGMSGKCLSLVLKQTLCPKLSNKYLPKNKLSSSFRKRCDFGGALEFELKSGFGDKGSKTKVWFSPLNLPLGSPNLNFSQKICVSDLSCMFPDCYLRPKC